MPKPPETAPAAAEKKTRQTPREKAQKAVDVTNRKIDSVTKRLTKAEQDVLDLKAELAELARVRDYQASHPALATSELTTGQEAPGELPGTEVS